MTENTRRALVFIAQHPGCTSIAVAQHLNVRHLIFGLQRAGSFAIAELRQLGLVQDVTRCEHCHRALTRHERNVPLFVTDRGQEEASAEQLALL